MATVKRIEILVTIDDEMVEGLFDDLEVKFSKAKLNKLKKLFEEDKEAFYEPLEEALQERLQELIEEEWGE
jgi:hypothetical protein